MKTLKREEIYANKHDDLENLRANIEEFVEQYYNRQRLHSALAIDLPKSSSNRSTRRVRPNGTAERWVGSCRRDLLDHVIALNGRHLKRLLREYISYHHEDRTHLGLGKETPGGRTHSRPSGRIWSQPRLGGLHHCYDWAA
jgi:transposase InsO family protein